MQYLIVNGANINSKASDGVTALHAAAAAGELEVVQYLVENGADLDSTAGEYSWTTLHFAAHGGHLAVVQYLIENQTKINCKDSDGYTALHKAASTGELQVVQYLVENGADLDSTACELRWTALHEAAYGGHLAVVQYLIENGTKINSKTSDGGTALHAAAVAGELQVVQYLVENGADLDSTGGEYSRTALHCAAHGGHLAVVQYLIENQTKINCKDSDGYTALHKAASTGELQVVQYLVENGADLDSTACELRWTALHEAAYGGHLAVVQYLIENGANINSKASDGSAALHVAAAAGELEVVQYLVRNGADLDSTAGEYSCTALQYAACGGHLHVFKYLIENGMDLESATSVGGTSLHLAAKQGHLPVLQYLIENGANINSKASHGVTALHAAATKGELEVVQYLVENGADLDSTAGEYSGSALLEAAYGGHLAVVQYLIENGTNVNRANTDGWTALHLAAQQGHLPVVQYLIENGTDINSKASNGGTALHAAAATGMLEVVQYLLKNGADLDSTEGEYSGSALLEAAYGGHLAVVQYLIENGTNINSKTSDGGTALLGAAAAGELEVVQYLVENGADLDSTAGEFSWTVLHFAASGGHLAVVQYLIENGANMDIMSITGETVMDIAKPDCKEFMRDYFLAEQQEMTWKTFDVLSDSVNKSIDSGEFDKETAAQMNEILVVKLSCIIEKDPDFVSDSSKMFLFYRGYLYKYLIELYVKEQDEDDKRVTTASAATLLKAVSIAIQSKICCEYNTRKPDSNEAKHYNCVKKKERLLELLGDNLYERFEKRIRLLKDDDGIKKESAYLDHWLIVKNVHDEFMKDDIGCVEKTKTAMTSCLKKMKGASFTCLRYCYRCQNSKRTIKKDEMNVHDVGKTKKYQLPKLSHRCSKRGSFALVSCSLALVFYMLDLITDFTVGLEDYNGFSKKLGTFELCLVVFTLIHENIQSSISLHSTQKELLRIKLAKQSIKFNDWNNSDLVNENPVQQIFYVVFWPFAVMRKTDVFHRIRLFICNLLTLIQLRPLVDRLRVLMHPPINVRIFNRQQAEQNSLKQFYLVTEQIPQLLIQFYTLQIAFNIGATESENAALSYCECRRYFSYDRFDKTLDNPEDRNWFCDQLPINSTSGLTTCNIAFRMFSVMIPLLMIPFGLVSLEAGLRALDPVTPKIRSAVKYLLHAAYALMIPARLFMFAAVMHSVSVKEVIFGYVIVWAALKFFVSLLELYDLRIFFEAKIINETEVQESYSSHVKKRGNRKEKLLLTLYNFIRSPKVFIDYFGPTWKTIVLSLRDVFVISVRAPQAYMEIPTKVTYDSIRDRKSLTKHCLVFLLEGVLGAWIIEEFYPCGRQSKVFRYSGWICLASLLLSVTLLTLIADLLHPRHLLSDKTDILKGCIKTAGVCVMFGLLASVLFCTTKQRTPAEKWVMFSVIPHLVISGIVILLIYFSALPSDKKTTATSSPDSFDDTTTSCCFTMCCPSYQGYRRVPSDPNDATHAEEDNISPKSLDIAGSSKSQHTCYIKMGEIGENQATIIEGSEVPDRARTSESFNAAITNSNWRPIDSKNAVSYQTSERTVTERVSSDETVPERVSSDETAPERVSNEETVPEQVPSTETVLEQVSDQETVSEQVSCKETVLEQVSSEGTVSEQVCSKETVSEQVSSKETAPEQVCSKETVSEQVCSKETVSEQVSSKETVPEQVSSKETVTEQVSCEETVPEQVSSEETVPEQVSCKETVSEQVSSKETVSEQVSCKETVPEQVSSKDTVPEQVSSKDTVPEQVSSKETVTEQVSRKETVLEQVSSKETVLEQVSCEDTVPEQVSSKETVLELEITSVHEAVSFEETASMDPSNMEISAEKVVYEEISPNQINSDNPVCLTVSVQTDDERMSTSAEDVNSRC